MSDTSVRGLDRACARGRYWTGAIVLRPSLVGKAQKVRLGEPSSQGTRGGLEEAFLLVPFHSLEAGQAAPGPGPAGQ